MNAEKLYTLLQTWSKSLWFNNFQLDFNKEIFENAIDIFQYDYLKWYPEDVTIQIEKLQLTPQLIAVLCYRIAHLYHIKNTGGYTKDIISLIGRTIGHIEIFYSSKIAKGLKINHGLATVIGARVTIGENCLIHQNITLGDKGGGRPTIGDNVIIYPGAMILGDISIGNNSIIAANSIVLISCPENSILIGVPAKQYKNEKT